MLSARFRKAFEFAFELHSGQKRKTTETPYVSHLMSVAALVLEYGGTEDEAIAALLHDALEDQWQKYGGVEPLAAEIKKRFGAEVLEIVQGCSEQKKKPRPPWREKKKEYIRQVTQGSDSVRLVAMCDKLHNVRTMSESYRQMGEDLWTIFTAGKDQTVWFYRVLAEAFQKTDAGKPVAEELMRAVKEFARVVETPVSGKVIPAESA